MKFLVECQSFVRFYFSIKRARRDLVFYAEDRESWAYFEGLIEHLNGELGQPVCYITSDAADPAFSRQNANFRVLYMKHLFPFLTVLLDSKILVMTMPDLDRFHIKRSVRGAHHVYLFHNIGSSFPVIRFAALFSYDTIMCSGPHHAEEIRRQEEIYNLKRKGLVEFGYYKLEKVYKEYMARLASSGGRPHRERPRVLLAPSWGDKSILNLCGRRLIAVMLDNGIDVIMRPHPMTRKLSPDLMRALNEEFGGRPGYVYEGDISGTSSFFDSDILICDWSGITFEYAFGTERPVLFIDVPRKIVNPRYEEVGIEPVDVSIRHRLGEIVSPESIEEVPVRIRKMIAEKDRYRDGIVKARGEMVYNFGSSSEAGADFLVSFLKGENKAVL